MHSKSYQKKPAKHRKTPCDKISKRSAIIFCKKLPWKEKRRCGIRNMSTTHIGLLFLTSVAINFDMEQFVLIRASKYNKKTSLKTQAVTKQELPEHQCEQNPRYKLIRPERT